MKNILVPTDFSDNAWDALTYAIRLFDDIPCCFYILNTYEVNPSHLPITMHQFGAKKVFEILKDESKAGLKKISDYLNSNMLNDKHTYETISKSGSLVSIVKDLVDKENIDLIVMGTTGASGLKEVFMGSNTVKVIKKIELCPVISVPEKYEYEEPAEIIFATDFKTYLNEMQLRYLIELQLIHNFKIRIVHVKKENKLSEKQRYNVEVLKKYFDEDVLIFEEIESDASLSKAITVFAEKQKANMICLVNHEHSLIEKLTHEAVIKRVSFHSSIPLLILPV